MDLKIATILLTYNRPRHTEAVLEALHNDYEIPQCLFVFHDGPNEDTDIDAWQRVEEIVRQIDFCPKEIITDSQNKGLSVSVVSSVNSVLKDYDAFILLEDDCVPARGFMPYMNQCLLKYENYPEVYCVSGYSWPIYIENYGCDAYMSGRNSSWGWGGWKNKWKAFYKDYEIIRKIKKKQLLSKNLALWGNDLEDMLVEQVRGNIDSWAVHWDLSVIYRTGVCVMPTHSLINNIGFDGTGVHCGFREGNSESLVLNSGLKEYKLPDSAMIPDCVISAFARNMKNYSNPTAANDGLQKERVIVYGLGRFFYKNEARLNDLFFINLIIDRRKRGYYAGKRICAPIHLKEFALRDMRILVMVEDLDECSRICEMLINTYGFDSSRIVVGPRIFGKGDLT